MNPHLLAALLVAATSPLAEPPPPTVPPRNRRGPDRRGPETLSPRNPHPVAERHGVEVSEVLMSDTITITIAALRAALTSLPCEEHWSIVEAEWPAEIPLVPATIARARELKLDLEWLGYHLPAPALAEYERACAPARAEYERACAPARAEYKRVCDTAMAEYERWLVALSAVMLNRQTGSRVPEDGACAPARAEYERICAPARAEYKRVCAPALAEYERACDTALLDALIGLVRSTSVAA